MMIIVVMAFISVASCRFKIFFLKTKQNEIKINEKQELVSRHNWILLHSYIECFVMSLPVIIVQYREIL